MVPGRAKMGAMSTKKRVLIAIGGNALVKDPKTPVIEQLRAAGETSHHVAAVVKAGHDVIITHGNGPQVGFSLLRSELARNVVHEVPLQGCVAETQGTIGYHIAQTLDNELEAAGIGREVAALVTRVVVDDADPAFAAPTKPIGPFFTEADAQRHAAEDGWTVREDSGRGWRRVVASPRPLEIRELAVIRRLFDAGVIVVCAGGGGIPVVRRAKDGRLRGAPAVIDKDLSSCLLARAVGVDTFVLTTGIDGVKIDFGKPTQRALSRLTVSEARRHLDDGQFPAGSMRPKIEAALDFLAGDDAAPGREVIITSPSLIGAAIRGEAGTRIVPDDA